MRERYEVNKDVHRPYVNSLLQAKSNLFRVKAFKKKGFNKLSVIMSRLYSICLSSIW